MSERLFTPRFFVMCGFTFTVFLSAFQLLPTAPFRILELGGSTFASGLFLGFLTYASALSAPFTGAIADRIGRRRTLIIASVVILLCAIGYGTTASYRVMLALVVVHGVFWSGLLSASAAYLTSLLPDQPPRRGHQLLGPVERRRRLPSRRRSPSGSWSTAAGSGSAFRAGRSTSSWASSHSASRSRRRRPRSSRCRSGRDAPAPIIEWRVLALSVTLFLYSFGYGAITSFSAMYADAVGVTPKSLYLTSLAIVILMTRPLSGKLADRIGYRRVFMPCLVLIAFGLALLTIGSTRLALIASAVFFGVGFGTAYPVFVAYVMRDVYAARRGAAFGAILAAFDTGIGTGSTTVGWLIQRFGFSTAFTVAAALSAVSLPYFLIADRKLR